MANVRRIEWEPSFHGGVIIPTNSPAVGKLWTATDTEGHGEWASPAKKKQIHEHGFSIQGVVAEVLYPGVFIKIAEGNTKKLIGVEYITSKGEAEFEIRQNEAAATGFTALVAKTAVGRTEPAAVSLASKDYLRLKVIKLTTAPENLAVTLLIEIEG